MSLKDEFAKEVAKPSILIMDIERLPGRARVWDQKTRFIPIRDWTQLPQTICIAFKWYEQKSVQFAAAWESDDPHHLATVTWALFDKATHVVGYNSKRFDEKHLRSLWVEAGLNPPRPWKTVDLYTTNGQFGFASKSLQHLCERLGVTGKHGHYSAYTAEAAMAGDKAAQRELRNYNKHDVIATEACFDRLRPWISGLNLGLFYGTDDQPRCANCGQTGTLEPAGWVSTALTRYAGYRCTSCGALMRNNHRKHSTTIRGIR